MKKLAFGLLLAFACCTGMTRQAQAHCNNQHCDNGHDGPHCWCEIFGINTASGANACKSGKKVDGAPGQICRYAAVCTGKENNCGGRCSTLASSDQGRAKGNAGSYCSQLGAGTHWIQYCSHVGAGALKNDPDMTIGKLNCVPAVSQGATCTCPAGFVLSGIKCTKPNVAATAKPCPAGYWAEPKFYSAAIPVCVKQACPQGSMVNPNVSAWTSIGVAQGTLPAYITDDKGGTRYFIAAGYTCPTGYNLSGNQCVWASPSNATCTCPAGFTLSLGATTATCVKAASSTWQ